MKNSKGGKPRLNQMACRDRTMDRRALTRLWSAHEIPFLNVAHAQDFGNVRGKSEGTDRPSRQRSQSNVTKTPLVHRALCRCWGPDSTPEIIAWFTVRPAMFATVVQARIPMVLAVDILTTATPRRSVICRQQMRRRTTSLTPPILVRSAPRLPHLPQRTRRRPLSRCRL